MIDFDKPIIITNWGLGKVIATVPTSFGLRLMAQSTRWGTEHTTTNVRELNSETIEELHQFLEKYNGMKRNVFAYSSGVTFSQ